MSGERPSEQMWRSPEAQPDALTVVHDVAEAGKALLRLEKWQVGGLDREVAVGCHHCGWHVNLRWTQDSYRRSVMVQAGGWLQLNGRRKVNWHKNDKPADLAATINAALDAAERAERAEKAEIEST